MRNVPRSGVQISQCQKVIKENNLEPIIAADTAGSAKFISINSKKDEAAIASTLAAKIYNLEEDPEQNHPFRDQKIESRMTLLLKKLMIKNEAPPEAFIRLKI